MSTSNFINGQPVKVIADHNQFNSSNDLTYHVACTNRIQGMAMVQLLHEGKVCGAIPENKLKAK